MFSKAFGFIRINPILRVRRQENSQKPLIFQVPVLDFWEGVEAGVKGETFYQLCKHSTSCLLLRVEVLQTLFI